MISRKTLSAYRGVLRIAVLTLVFPLDAGAANSPVQLRISATGTPELSWPSETGAVYRIQGSTDLRRPWQTIEPVVADSSVSRWKAPELNAHADTHFFRLVMPGPAIFSVEPARFALGGPTEVYVVGQCFGPETELRVDSGTLDYDIVNSGLIRGSFTPTVPGTYVFDLVSAGTVLSSSSVQCFEPGAPPPAVLQEPPTEPFASPVTKVAGDKTLGITVALAPDWSLGGDQFKVKEKGNRTKCSSNLRIAPSGEVEIEEVDLVVPGVGLDFVWARTYRSLTGRPTSMGNRWDHSYNVFAEQETAGIAVNDGTGRRDLYLAGTNGIYTQDELFNAGTVSNGAFRLTFPDTGYWEFQPFDGSAAAGRLARVVDRNGNMMRLEYDPTGRLVRIIDTLDRAYIISYDSADGKISSLRDFTGRSVTYAYYRGNERAGNPGDLKSVTSPAVTGTPNKNDFPDGKTTTYIYTTEFADPRENGLLTSITDPKGQTTQGFIYQVGSSGPNNLRCLGYAVSGSAGMDRVIYNYLPQRPSPANRFAAMKVIVNDRVGNVTELSFDARHRLVLRREFTGRSVPGVRVSEIENRPTGKLRTEDPDYFETAYEWNNDSLCTRIVHPRGNATEMIYQRAFNQNSSRSNHARRRDGDVRVLRERACCNGADTDGDGLSDLDQVTQRFTYDERFGSPALENRSHPSGPSSAKIIMDRDSGRSKGFGFATEWTDAAGARTTASYDERGNLLHTQTTERKSGEIIACDFDRDRRGRLMRVTHPADGNGCRRVDTFEYYDDPVAAGFGYLKKSTKDNGSLVCGETDHFRIATTYEYDARGNVIRCVDPLGWDSLLTYNALDQIVRSQTPYTFPGAGIRGTVDYSYDANDNLVRIDTENRDDTGTLDPVNPWWTTEYTYDPLNRLGMECVEIAHEGLKACTGYGYDANDNLVLQRSPEAVAGRDPNAMVRFAYDERGLRFREMRAPGTGLSTIDQFDYDGNANCRKISKVDALTIKQTTIEFDGFNRPVRVTDAMGNVEISSFDINGNLVYQRLDGETNDVGGGALNRRLREGRCEYDSLNRLVRFRLAFFDILTQAPIADGEATTSFSYAPDGQLLSETDDNGYTTRYHYDSASRLLRLVDPKTNTVTYAYDATGNPTNVTTIERSDLGGAEQRFSLTYRYDPRGRLTHESDNVGNTERYFYDSRGNLVRRIDARGSLVGWTYDGLSRCTLAIADLDGDGVLDYAADVGSAQAWDDNSRLISTTDDNGNVTRYGYDSLDRLLTTTHADNAVQSLVWSPRSNLLRIMDPNGTVISNSYDLLGRCVRRDITPSPGVADITTFETFDYDGESRLVRAANNGIEHRFIWNSCADLAGQSAAGVTLRAMHDGVGNRLACTYPSGVAVLYSYDTLNQLATLSTDDIGGVVRQHAAFGYDGPGRLARIARPNGINTRINWNGLQEPPNHAGDFGWRQVARVNHARSGVTPVDQRVFAYDETQNKTLRAQVTPFTGNGVTQTNAFAFNKLHRLTRGKKSRGAVVEQETEYQLDGMGNRQAVIENGALGRYTMDAAAPEPADFQMNQYTLTPFGPRRYDRNGNQISIDGPAGATMFTYDYADRLVAVDQSVGPALQPIAEYAYDALGRRISKTVFPPAPLAPVTTEFFYDGARIIETREDGLLTAAYLYSPPQIGDEVLVAFNSGSQALYFHNDDLGNTLALTDSAGRVLERYDYADYGSPQFLNASGELITDSTGQPAMSSQLGNPFLFHGMQWDAEIGLYHAKSAHTSPLYDDQGREVHSPLYTGSSRLYVGNLSWSGSADHYDPMLGRYITRGSDGGNNQNWNFGGGTLRGFAGDNPWTGQRRGASTRDCDGLVFNVVNPRAARSSVEVMFNPKEYSISKVTVRGWDPKKKEAIVGSAKKEEGGRHTPFHNKYRPGFYNPPIGVIGEVARIDCRETTTGLDVEYRLYGPGAAHWGQAKFASACTLGGSKELQSWWQEAAKGKNIRKNLTINLRTHQQNRSIRGHRDVGGYRAGLIVPIAMDKGLRFALREDGLNTSPTTGNLELIIK